MEIYGFCQRCQAPVFLSIDVDHEAYKVETLRCWNGHYESLRHRHPCPQEQARPKVKVEIVSLSLFDLEEE